MILLQTELVASYHLGEITEKKEKQFLFQAPVICMKARGMLSISFDFGMENVPHRSGSQNLVKSSSPKLNEIEINLCIFFCSQSI